MQVRVPDCKSSGDALHGILGQLVKVRVLEFRDDEERWRQYRWAVADSEHALTKR